MSMTDVQTITLIEAVVLLASNLGGGGLAALAWCVSDVDVREARRWKPPTADIKEQMRLHHNRIVVTEDMRYGEARRFLAHILIGIVGLFWLLTPQPVNPAVIWWAVAIRAVVLCLSLVLIDKTLHHLAARYRFDKPRTANSVFRYVVPSLRLAWIDMKARNEAR